MERYNSPEEAYAGYQEQKARGDEQAHLASESAAAEADALAQNEEEAMTNKTAREQTVEKIATTLSELYGRSMEVHKREARLIIDELESFGYVQKDPDVTMDCAKCPLGKEYRKQIIEEIEKLINNIPRDTRNTMPLGMFMVTDEWQKFKDKK